jgi:histidinol-phosphate aminotransferase
MQSGTTGNEISPMTRTFDIAGRVRKNILKMKPYSSARDEFKGEAEVFLDANENPYPTGYNRYPDPLQWAIKKQLAVLKNVRPEQIFLGNGSDEAIDLLIRAFCEPGTDAILIAEPTYGMYSVCADINAVNIQSVSLTPEFDIDLGATLSSINQSTKIVFLCSPNNPSGNILDAARIETILNTFDGLVVIDEAYIDFASSRSFIQRLNEWPNLVVLQTFSKAWGLAALRCGMAFASEEIVGILNKIKYPYNINIQTQQLVHRALERQGQKDQWVNQILDERRKLVTQLQSLAVVERVYPSDANFVLVKVKDAARMYQYLMGQRIIVRDRSRVKLCDNCLRITIGTAEENSRLIQTMKTFTPEAGI